MVATQTDRQPQVSNVVARIARIRELEDICLRRIEAFQRAQGAARELGVKDTPSEVVLNHIEQSGLAALESATALTDYAEELRLLAEFHYGQLGERSGTLSS